MRRMAILCSGGDVSGMNAALKRFVEYALMRRIEPFFVYDGYEGLIDGRIVKAGYEDVARILTLGGTNIGSARSKRFMEASYRAQAARQLQKRGIEGIVVLGGEGSFKGMQLLHQEHAVAVAGIPSTIDNDIAGTEYCLGVDTALNTVKCQIDAVRDTAASFRRAFVIETMGRECGYLALVSALTSGAEMCLIPELPYDLQAYEARFKRQLQEGRRYFIAVVAEALKKTDEIAAWFESRIGVESRTVVLGHTQRGGNPTVYDRITAFRFVTRAVDELLRNRSGVVCLEGSALTYKKVEDVAFKPYRISEELLALWE